MGTTAQKLNRVLETKSDLKTVINYSGANITNETTFKEYPKLLNKAYIDILNDEGESLYNALPKTTGTGTKIDLNTEKGKMKIELNSTQIEQVSTSGNNLIKFPNIAETTVNGITYSIQDDVISLNGTATDNVRYIYASNFAFNGAGDYRITLIPVSGNYTTGVIGISSRTEDKTTQIVWQQVASGAMTNKKTYTAENISQIKNIGIYINNGSVLNNLKFKFMFTKGDTTPTTFENMNSPTPDYPQDIHVITGDNNIKIQNKNLLYSNLEYPFTTRGVTVTQEDDGSITLNGTQSGGAMHIIFNNAFFDNIKKYEGTEISISLTTSGQGSFSNFGIKNGTAIDLLISNSPSLSKTDILNLNNYTNICFDIWFSNTSRTFVNYNIKPQVETGKRTEYVQYQEQNYLLSLGSLEYSKIGNYANQLFKNTPGSEFYDSTLLENEWYLHKEIYKYIVTGNETFNNTHGTNLFGINRAFYSTPFVTGYGLSTYYVYNPIQSGINANTENGEFALQYQNGDCNLFFKNTSFNNPTDFKNDVLQKYNNGNPIIIMFPLQNPQNIQITDATLIQQLENIYNNAKSNDGINHITQTNEDLPFNLEVSALAKIE